MKILKNIWGKAAKLKTRSAMKLAALAAVLGLGTWLLHAAPITLIGSLLTVNGTTNSTSTAVGTVTLNYSTLYVQNGGLTTTNAMLVYGQISVDNTNWLTVATYTASVTNAGTGTWIVPGTNYTLWGRFQIQTTNATGMGISLQQ